MKRRVMEDIVEMPLNNYTEKLWSAAMDIKSNYSYKNKKESFRIVPQLSMKCFIHRDLIWKLFSR